jgi:hypothetical protein
MAARVDHVARDDDVGVGEDAIGLVLVAGLPVEDVVGGLALLVVADDRRVRIARLARVDDRRERVVLDIDELERVARRVAVVGDDERDLLALKAHFVGRQDGLGVVGQRRHPREVQALEVLAGDDRAHLRMGECGRRVDRDDARVRERAAQHGAVEHAGQVDVVDVVALAADEARVLLALEAPEADGTFLNGGHQAVTSSPAPALAAVCAVSCSAAQRIALTMFV